MSKEEVREQLMFADKAIRELKKKQFELLEAGKAADDITAEIDEQMNKLMALSISYSKY